MMTKFEELNDFISNKMRMSHIYQPVMLKTLLSQGGSAPITTIALSLLSKDQSQLDYYQHITKTMVGKVLTKNRGITERLGDEYHLKGFDELSQEQVDELIMLCEEKIDGYIEKRGKAIWSHRTQSSGYISGTVRYEVLKRAKHRCELCGISAEVKAIEVDHIRPRNKGGSDDISNLQALCYSCNSMKRDRDDTDFRGVASSYKDREEGCLFCEEGGEEQVQEEASDELCYSRLDGYAVTPHHTLIIPRRHGSSYFDLYQPEINAMHRMLNIQKKKIEEMDSTVTGFNIGVNSGEDAGQTIFHVHLHLIPRRSGDVENPRGGVRGVIPGRQSY